MVETLLTLAFAGRGWRGAASARGVTQHKMNNPNQLEPKFAAAVHGAR
jgi:hypothetical protein